jgi:hypothetical protein
MPSQFFLQRFRVVKIAADFILVPVDVPRDGHSGVRIDFAGRRKTSGRHVFPSVRPGNKFLRFSTSLHQIRVLP